MLTANLTLTGLTDPIKEERDHSCPHSQTEIAMAVDRETQE